jgi:hypothetical protein
MKLFKFSKFIFEKDTPKPKGAPDWHDSDAPDAEGRFRDLSIKDLAAWLIKTRKEDVRKISGSLTQQIVFNRKKDPKYAEKMEKTRKEVYKQLGREDLLEESTEGVYDIHKGYLKEFEEFVLEQEINELKLSAVGAKDALRDMQKDPDLLDYLGFGSLRNAIRFIKFANIEMWDELTQDIQNYYKDKK